MRLTVAAAAAAALATALNNGVGLKPREWTQSAALVTVARARLDATPRHAAQTQSAATTRGTMC